MTPADLTAWRAHMKFSKAAAARQLGCHENSIANWEQGATEIPHYIVLACSALTFGIPAWPPQPSE